MGLGRGIAVGACIGALGLVSLGCGAEEHANVQRPSPPVRVSVAIHSDSITGTPSKVGLGPEKSKLIDQNKDEKQPSIRTAAPLTVVFVSANLTPTDSN